MHNTRKEKGFSLVELSVVLIIISLITAGIFAGQSIVKAAKLNKFVSELSSIQISYNTFQSQFKYPPGDMKNAHDFWGNACDTTASKCNGEETS